MAWIRKHGGWAGLIAANVFYLGILTIGVPINQPKVKVLKAKVVVNTTISSDYEERIKAPTHYCKAGKHRYRCT